MAIVQKIEFKAPYQYFAGFLQGLVYQSGVVASVVQKEGYIELCLDESDSKALENFSFLAQKYLPHSIFLGEVTTQNQEINVEKSTIDSPNYKLAPCPECLEMVTNPASEHYLDDSLVCTYYANSGTPIEDWTTFSPHYSKGDTVLVCDFEKIDELFYMTQSEKMALFSIEKPTLKVTIASQKLIEQTGKNYINIKSAPTIKSTLAALNAKESGLEYLFFDDRYNISARVIKDDLILIENGALESLELLNEDAKVNRFLNIKKEAAFEKAIGARFATDLGFEFYVSDKDVQKVLSFKPFVFEDMIVQMQNDSVRSVLLENFGSQHPSIKQIFCSFGKDDFFEAVAVLLELEGGYEVVSEKALEYRGNGGVKLDTKFVPGGFDYMNFLASIISFKLAGTSTAHLAYSVFESLADLGISMMGELEKKLHINHFVMLGDMFENSVFYSRIKSKFAMSNPYFAKAIGLS